MCRGMRTASPFPRGIPYLVYLPDGSYTMARTDTADHAWAVAYVSESHTGWYVKGVFNTAFGGSCEIAATAERITEDEALRYARRGATQVRM